MEKINFTTIQIAQTMVSQHIKFLLIYFFASLLNSDFVSSDKAHNPRGINTRRNILHRPMLVYLGGSWNLYFPHSLPWAHSGVTSI